MIVLRKNIQHFRLIGMYLKENQRKLSATDFAYNLFFCIPLFLTTGGTIAHFVYYLSDILEASKALYVICAFFMYLAIYWIFALQKPRVQDIFEELQAIIDQSELITDATEVGCLEKLAERFSLLLGANRSNFEVYEEIERKSEYVTAKFTTLILFAASGCWLLPAMECGSLYLRGEYTHDSWYSVYAAV